MKNKIQGDNSSASHYLPPPPLPTHTLTHSHYTYVQSPTYDPSHTHSDPGPAHGLQGPSEVHDFKEPPTKTLTTLRPNQARP